MPLRQPILILLLCLLGPVRVRADVVCLKNGKRLQGVISSRTRSGINVDFDYGTVWIPRSKILSIRKSSRKKEASEEKLFKRLQAKSEIEYEHEPEVFTPKGAQGLARLLNKARQDRPNALRARDDLKDLAEKKDSFEGQIPLLRARDEYLDMAKGYAPEDNSLIALDNEVVSRLNFDRDALDDIKERERWDNSLIYRYLVSYNGLKRGYARLAPSLLRRGPKSLQAKYCAWVLGKIKEMKSDFKSDSVATTRIGNGESVFVTALLNGRVRARLLVDSGASGVLLSARVAAKLGLGPEDVIGRSLSRGIDQRAPMIPTTTVRLKSIAVGGARLQDVTADVLPADQDDPSNDGLLGMGFLGHFAFEIAGNRLILNTLK